jgi:hypothetical protein
VSRLRAQLRINGETTFLIAEEGDLISGVWYHAALIYDSSARIYNDTNLRLFLDGIEVGVSSDPLPGPVDNGNEFTVTVGGPIGGTNQFFKGRMDDVRISQRALTEDELMMIVDGKRNQPVAPTTLSFLAIPNIVSPNGQTILNWSAPYATECTASGAWSGIKGASGSESICSIATDSQFELSCSGPGGTIDDIATVSVSLNNNYGAALLSWTAPTENTDGSELTDLAGYNIYYGTSSGNYCNSISIDISDMEILDYLVENLANSGWYFVMTAVNSWGIESDYSAEVSKTIE